MTFHLYDSAERKVVEMVTVVPGQVSIYHCGMTVDDAPHLGHIRKEVVFDVLRRWLTYGGYQVTVVANITDIDDKILAKSAAAGVPWWAHAYRYERELHAAYAALGCEPPTYEPRATGHIPEMIMLTQQLIDRGHAYAAPDGSGDVYFDVLSWPDYGRLSGQRVADMEPAADADPRGKRDPRDFALWKGSGPNDPPSASWPSPWGPGRPGWHLECSAMAGKYLGATFDIHGGGIDLRFPHHENELAQSSAAGFPFAKYWMHSAWVTAAGEKMSKSLGNTARVTEVTKKFPARAVRLYLAAPHYRSSVELSDTSLEEAATSLARIDSFLTRAGEVADAVPGPVPADFAAALDDDLGTPAAMAIMYQAIREGNVALEQGDTEQVGAILASVRGMLGVFGLDPSDEVWSGGAAAERDLAPVVDGLVSSLLQQRQEARSRKDYAAADAIRDQLAGLGVAIEDTASGPRWSLER